MKKKNSTITISSRHKMYQDKMAMISAFSQLVLLLVTAEVTSALNSPVPVVHTISNVTLISGMEATLSCNYNRTVYAVYWRYESTTSPMELLVAQDKHYEEGKRSGPGYDEGLFDMTDDYSLIIRDVKATDEGTYICEVSDFETGQVFRNHTDVTTVVIAERPFVRIEQCKEEVSADEISESSCSLHTTTDDSSIELTCTVFGAKPLVDITWESSMSSEHWKQVMNESNLSTRDRGNGVFDQTLTVIVDTSYIKSKNQHFTCVAKGLAVDKMANYTIAVYPAQAGSYRTRTVVISVVCTLFFTFVIIGVLWTWWRVREKRRSQNGEDPENQQANTPLTQIDGDAVESTRESGATSENIALLEEKRTAIREYQPNKPTTTNETTTYINIGIFGLTNAGKLSFINSLIFALTGNYHTAADNQTYGGIETESKELTDHIHFIKFKGMMNYELDDVSKFYRVIRPGQGTRNSPEDQIYCPIFVLDYSTYTEQCRKSMKAFSDYARSYLGMGITVVVTKKDTFGGDDAIDMINLIKAEMSKATGVTEKRIGIFENYTGDNHEEDVERSIEFLDFILQCLDVVKDNQKFI